MWFEAHDTMARHPKTLKLARLLGVDRRYAVGLLHDLFSWGLYSAGRHGELIGLTAADIAQAMDFPQKKAVSLADALVESGYLDRMDDKESPWVYAIHDWYDYAGKLFEKREKDRGRMRDARASQKRQD